MSVCLQVCLSPGKFGCLLASIISLLASMSCLLVSISVCTSACRAAEKYGERNKRCGSILMCLRYMAEADQVHHSAIESLVTDRRFQSLEIPQLFKESFIGLDD